MHSVHEAELVDANMLPGGHSVQFRLVPVEQDVLTYVPAGQSGQARHLESSFCVQGEAMYCPAGHVWVHVWQIRGVYSVQACVSYCVPSSHGARQSLHLEGVWRVQLVV